MSVTTDDNALKIIAIRNDERRKAYNFLQLYQEFAELGYPVEDQITTKKTPGSDESLNYRDPTAIFALEKATSGFIGAWIPRERFFFGIKIKNRQFAELDHVKRWCALAVQIAHDELFDSNYMLQLHNTVKSDIGFGTGCNYSEWDYKARCLNFADWHVSQFNFRVNSRREVDEVLLSYKRTARQIVDMPELNNPGKQVEEAAEKTETENKLFDIIHIVRPRIEKTYHFVDKNNMPYESLFVNETEKITMKKGGFPRFPFAVPRWEVASCEKWGRGRGIMMLSFIKELQQMRMDYMEACNRWNRPPYAKRSDLVEGEVNMKPDGCNDVTGDKAITPLNPTLYGNMPITVEALNDQRQMIKEGFYNDIFSQFTQLKGDRRTTTEIELRYKEGLRQLISPVARQEVELFNAQLENVIPLLIEWGRIPPAPSEIRGQEYSIEYQGELAMAIRDLQTRGFERAMSTMGQLAATIPSVRDYMEITLDKAMSDVFTNYGMRVEHQPTPEELAAKRQKRAQEEQQQKLAQLAASASDAYHKTTGAPEKGSPAEALVGQGQGA